MSAPRNYRRFDFHVEEPKPRMNHKPIIAALILTIVMGIIAGVAATLFNR